MDSVSLRSMATMLNIPMICVRSAVISWDWLSFGLLVKSIVGTTEGFIFFSVCSSVRDGIF